MAPPIDRKGFIEGSEISESNEFTFIKKRKLISGLN